MYSNDRKTIILYTVTLLIFHIKILASFNFQIYNLTRKRLGFVTRYSAKAPVFSQKLRFPAVFATLACRKKKRRLTVAYQSSHKNQIRRGIEEVITGLTRNRMSFMYPPFPGTLDFTGFSEGSKAKNLICSPHQFSPKSEVFFGGQM